MKKISIIFTIFIASTFVSGCESDKDRSSTPKPYSIGEVTPNVKITCSEIEGTYKNSRVLEIVHGQEEAMLKCFDKYHNSHGVRQYSEFMFGWELKNGKEKSPTSSIPTEGMECFTKIISTIKSDPAIAEATGEGAVFCGATFRRNAVVHK